MDTIFDVIVLLIIRKMSNVFIKEKILNILKNEKMY
jgi:hypothetical protein